MGESWLPVRDFEGLYEVSDLARVRSLPRTGSGGVGRRGFPGQVLKPWVNPDGYGCVSLHRAGRRYLRRVHELVAGAFIGPRPEGLDVCHDDGDPGNDLPGNLYYGTRADNMQDCLRHGRNRNASKTHCKRRHELAGANLDPSFKHGRRCLACSRAWSNVQHAAKHGIERDIQIESDRHYAALLAAQ